MTTPNPALAYLDGAQTILNRIRETQLDAIGAAAKICADSIAAGGLVHLFGTGHSRIAVEEIFPRHGSFPGFHPIVELSLTNHTQVVGSNGQRQAMFLERVAGFGEVILRNFVFGPHDSFMVFSNGGVNEVILDVALGAKQRGMPVIAVVSVAHCSASTPRHSSGKRLIDVADVVIDNCSPPGDALVKVEGLEYPVGPGSTVGYGIVVNMLKCLVADDLTQRGQPPLVLTSGVLIGSKASGELFDRTYDDYRARVAQVYGRPGHGKNDMALDRFRDKVALVTGAGGGIGRATALRLAAEGARVAALDQQADAVAETVAAIVAAGGQALPVIANITQSEQVRYAVEQILTECGRLDVVFNGVGISGRRWGDGPVDQCTEEGWAHVLEVNLTSMFLVCKHTVPALLQSHGAIVNLSSVLGIVGGDEDFATHAYAASKAGIIGLSRAMASYYAPQGLRVNVIAPGLIATPMSLRAQSDPHIQERLVQLQPLTGTMGAPEDVAAAAAYLLSDDARFVTGTVMTVDGGWTVR